MKRQRKHYVKSLENKKVILDGLVQRLRDHGENVNENTDPSYLIGKNMMTVDQELRSTLGEEGYQKMLDQNFEDWKKQAYEDPIQRKLVYQFLKDIDKRMSKIFK